MQVFREEPLPLIVYDTNRFRLTEEALALLQAIEGPVGVVAVAGLYRTGKSYLLNRMLLNRSQGFGVGPTINPCTKGLWVWGKPIPGQTPEGDPLQVLIIDTEGLGALDEDSNHDVRIFSLAILLSSFFIYNSVGSIDEAALSNLSLVVNLTKNIQIKAQPSSEEGHDTDLEEYAQYFPSFMWVVRDFALQLIDAEGEPICPKDYLEIALETQKGFSDSVEQKNRIRRLLKNFFRDRDCCTMIRPLTNEENLQNLPDMDLEELRGDFVEQVISLRRKVINRIKPKTLNGRKLSGSMLATLANTYVKAINNGAIPNIESAWSYLCKSECRKAMDEATKLAKQVLEVQAASQLPLDLQELHSVVKAAKREALAIFEKKAVGQHDEQRAELKTQLRQIAQRVVDENERLSEELCRKFLQDSYFYIDRKLKSMEFQHGFIEYLESDMRAFQGYYRENGPRGPHRERILNEFVAVAVGEAAEFFNRGLRNDLQIHQQLTEERTRHLEGQLMEARQDLLKERGQLEDRVRQSEYCSAQLAAAEIIVREQLEVLKLEKSAVETELRTQLDTVKSTLSKEVEDWKAKASLGESTSAELQRGLMQAESNREKDRALFDQKIEFLERTFADYQRKEADSSSNIIELKREQTAVVREMQLSHEKAIRELTQRLEDAQERLLEVQGDLESLEQKYSLERKQWDTAHVSLRSSVNVSLQQHAELQRQLEEARVQLAGSDDRLKAAVKEAEDEANHKVQALEEYLNAAREEAAGIRNATEKDAAIFQQKLEFKDLQNQELRAQLDDLKRVHDQTLRTVESKTRQSLDGRDAAQQHLTALQESHAKELEDIIQRGQQERRLLEITYEALSEKHSDLEGSFKLLEAESQQRIEGLLDQVAVLEQAKARAQEQTKSHDAQRLRLLEEAEQRFTATIESLERELEQREARASEELKDIQDKSEAALAQLRNFYEIEKERMEMRLTEERDRSSKKLAIFHEETEQRLRDEQTQHEEDVQLLQEELREAEHRQQVLQAQAEHEHALMKQKMDSLESYLRDKEDRLVKEQSMTVAQMDAQLDRFANVRREMEAKIELLNVQATSKDREIAILRSKLETATEEADKRRRQLEDSRLEASVERLKLSEKIDGLRARVQEQADESMQRRLEDGREIALYKQKLEFYERKIEDLQRTCDEQYAKFEERFQAQRAEYQQEAQELIFKSNHQREQAEAKYEAKRKHYKESQQGLLRQAQDLARDKAILQEKLDHAENIREELRTKLEAEMGNFREHAGSLAEALNREREQFLAETDRLRAALQEQERELSDLQAVYEREQALWEGKFGFLESQRDQAKADLQEAAKKFEMTLEQLQRRGNAEKDKVEQSQTALLSSLDTKFKQQLKDHQEQAARDKQDLSEKLRAADKECRQLVSRLQVEQRDRLNEHAGLQKKLQELMESEVRLQKENEEIRTDRDRRAADGAKAWEREREAVKSKMADVEQRCKELDSRRATLMFEHEKEKARWGLEKDHLVGQRQEFQEHVDRLQRRTEDLLKENEKLKSERLLRKQPSAAKLSSFGLKLATKENPNRSFIGDGLTEPFAVRENNSCLPRTIRSRMGSPTQMQPLSLTTQFFQVGKLASSGQESASQID